MFSVVNTNKCLRNQCKSFSNSSEGREKGREAVREEGTEEEKKGRREVEKERKRKEEFQTQFMKPDKGATMK